ncbi:MAG: DUF1553 domain-containing protein [Verrucomicrobiales bacterium]|nr:DUF1553 domain-containing protein [Verrucomicrobiales bacterium]
MRFYLPIAIIFLTVFANGREIDFNRDVRPILSDKCFKCHGPDATNQKSEFRIDTLEHATADLGDYFGVVPGDLKNSETHWRIHSDDPTDIMPPPEAKMQLTAKEIAILDQWIEEGAKYADHWAFVPVPESIPVPKLDSDEASSPIDAFIRKKLSEEGFVPSKETTREKWLRRVTFDLTGLPPTVDELEAFLADQSPNAYEKIVDELFTRDSYAERMTAEWMDVARYSDSYGFQVDRDRTVWQWRDWVIQSFKNNLPYDDFITWQLAGDLLPNATRDQILATTFNRLHPQKVEGGSVPEEFRVEYVSDRLHTYGTAFLGLTMECCRCHDHKYDPTTAKDYYQLSAFFSNIDEAGLYSFFTPAVPTPTLWLPDEKQSEELTTLERNIAESNASLKKIATNAKADFTAWAATNPTIDARKPIASFSFDTREKDIFPNASDPDKPAKSPAKNTTVEGKFGKAVKLTGDDAITLPVGNFTRDDEFSVSLWVKTPDTKERAVIFSRSKAWTDAASRGYELLLEEGKLSAALIHFYPGNAIRVRAKEPLTPDEWRHVSMTYDGSSEASGLKLYVDGALIETEVVRDELTREITGGGSDTIVIGERMRDNGFKNGLVDEFKVFNHQLSPAEANAIAGSKDTFSPDIEFYLSSTNKESVAVKAALSKHRKARSELVKKVPEIMVMRESESPRQNYLLDRGLYSNRGEPVSPDTPHFLPPGPDKANKNRLDLAKWTVADNNPLTARVTVNRYWQMLFGRGLVSTSEDFGSQGKIPSHPELLDWLARDFMEHGWDVRGLLRQIVLSATYRQESEIRSGELVAKDPTNTLLYRFPAPRLSAEMIRDNALAVSGLLAEKTGGPSVKPYDIEVSFKPSKIGTGDDLYRRSLYTYWKQTAPAPLMTTLNASKRDVCRVRLEKTDTPLQGLVMLNSPQFVEAARHLATILVSKHGEDQNAIITEAFQTLTTRAPDETEFQILTDLFTEQESHFESDIPAAQQLIAAGNSPPPSDGQAANIAAATTLVTTLMNFDECITKR